MRVFNMIFVIFIVINMISARLTAQESIPTIAVLNIDNTNADLSPSQLASLTRIEVTKLGDFEVYDQYDIAYLFKTNEFDSEDCYGKICLIEAGKILGVDKVLSGSVETFEQHIVITLRQVDVHNEKIEKAQVMEFLKIENQLFSMIELTVQKMYGMEMDENVEIKLTKRDDFESTINVPDADVLNLSGPRMGLTFFVGEAAEIYQKPLSKGGYNGLPLLSQFGYQFEIKYLNSGNVQALFEIIPVFTGLDQGRIIPSITILSGIRSNKTGLEFAFGPNIFLTQEAEGFIDDNGDFQLRTAEMNAQNTELITRTDSRGDFTVGSGIVIAAGKTFRSGKLNVPVNVFYIPGKNTQRFGVSFGFNINKKK